jgi:murein DD-endopeptidase MepM/ murein hydrolase activator NlpD
MKKMHNIRLLSLSLQKARATTVGLLCLTLLFGLFPVSAFAEVTSENISDKQDELQSLEAQIQESHRQLDAITAEKQSLSQELALAEATLANITKQQKLTSLKISKAEKTIQGLQNKIVQLERGITSNSSSIESMLRDLNRNDNISLLSSVFSPDASFSDIAQFAHETSKLEDQIRKKSAVMRSDQVDATKEKESLTLEKAKLLALQTELADKGRIAANEKKARDKLLSDTKNKETSYKTYIADLEARKKKLDDEINSYEAGLRFTLDPKNLPKAIPGTLGWPVSDVLITQRFGKTVDAKRLYVSGSHSGVDFRASVGTPVYAVADGVVEGTGDTDQTCYKASFGKWVFIRHNNGLSTAYGHLSLIKVSEGARVKKGDLIAYSGNTGHSTGPHLHLTVYASYGVDGGEGARVTERPSEACKGAVYRMPLAPTNAYLDPLLYLPSATTSMFKDQKFD